LFGLETSRLVDDILTHWQQIKRKLKQCRDVGMSYGPTAWVRSGGNMAPAHSNIELLPDENPDLRAEIIAFIGEDWLNAPNSWFSGRLPSDLLGTDQEPLLRDRVRSIKSAEFT